MFPQRALIMDVPPLYTNIFNEMKMENVFKVLKEATIFTETFDCIIKKLLEKLHLVKSFENSNVPQ